MPIYKPGEHLVCCDRCGFRRFSSELRREWNGFYTCPECFENKHPQCREPSPLGEKQTVKPYLPEGVDTFITTPVTPDDL